MKKLLCGIFVILILTGCYWTEIECFPCEEFMEVNFITTSKVDSVDIFLDGRHVCHQDSAMFFVKDLASGLFFWEREYGEDSLMWFVFHCFLGRPKDKINMSSVHLEMHVFDKGKEERIRVDTVFDGGNIINMLPVQDTVVWFGYIENPILPSFEWFDAPALSKRYGCFAGYCAAIVPMPDDDVCFDK